MDTAVATGAYDNDELLVATVDVLKQAERRNKLYCDFSLVCPMKYHVALRYPIDPRTRAKMAGMVNEVY